MKFNWGTGIFLSFVAFIVFILYFVVLSFRDPQSNHDLVTEDYYQQELKYQQDIDASANLNKSGAQIQVTKIPEGLSVVFPATFTPDEIKGTVSLYRPSNKQLDFKTPIQLSERQLLIPKSRLLDGRWDIRIEWTYEGKPYLYQNKLTY
ncbi:FixH family protein [Robiginitalea sp.]|jgi:nitrogen fixation protein FixH|uniref:FixH family protein n=1 Tax=Robiginitalea sp. TaxID=1902411 RepID=UPI003C727F3F